MKIYEYKKCTSKTSHYVTVYRKSGTVRAPSKNYLHLCIHWHPNIECFKFYSGSCICRRHKWLNRYNLWASSYIFEKYKSTFGRPLHASHCGPVFYITWWLSVECISNCFLVSERERERVWSHASVLVDMITLWSNTRCSHNICQRDPISLKLKDKDTFKMPWGGRNGPRP